MKSNNPIEFGVTAVTVSGNRAVVEGRCHRGPIFPEQKFILVSSMTVQVSPEVCGPTTLNPIGSVELRIDSIWAYGRQIDELSQTMTARLELSGSGVDKIEPGLVLS
jgi:hypothetical protein